jgi:hypothetical protein
MIEFSNVWSCVSVSCLSQQWATEVTDFSQTFPAERQTDFFQICTQVELSKDPPILLDLPIMHIQVHGNCPGTYYYNICTIQNSFNHYSGQLQQQCSCSHTKQIKQKIHNIPTNPSSLKYNYQFFFKGAYLTSNICIIIINFVTVHHVFLWN